MPKRKRDEEKCISRYDFTLPLSQVETLQDVHELLRPWCNKYVFQKEKGDTGYLHWQGRMNLIKPRRYNTLKGLWEFPGKFSPTSNPEYQKASFSYVMKADTRVEGPFTDQDFKERPPMTRQLTEFMKCEMREWQKQIIEMCKEEEDRTIKLIYDDVGNTGKSIMCEYLRYHDLATTIPPMTSMEDIMACVMCKPVAKCYLIDMPRGMKKDHLAQFYSGLECIKNGYVYDKRYSYREKQFDRPQVIVFTNCLPNKSLLSLDRWECWAMMGTYSLRKIVLTGMMGSS